MTVSCYPGYGGGSEVLLGLCVSNSRPSEGEDRDEVGEECTNLVQWNLDGDFGVANTSPEAPRGRLASAGTSAPLKYWLRCPAFASGTGSEGATMKAIRPAQKCGRGS
jgi:hypothetical protein